MEKSLQKEAILGLSFLVSWTELKLVKARRPDDRHHCTKTNNNNKHDFKKNETATNSDNQIDPDRDHMQDRSDEEDEDDMCGRYCVVVCACERS